MASSITKQAYTRQDMYGVGSASGSGCEPAGSWIGSSRTKLAPRSRTPRGAARRPSCAPARGRWPGRGRSRPRPTARCRARSARRCARDRRAGRRARRRRRRPSPSRRGRRAPRGRSRPTARGAARCRCRMRTTRATAPGSPLPQHGPGGARDVELDVALGARAARTRRPPRGTARRARRARRAARTSASSRLRSSSSLASRARRRSSRWAPLHLAPGVLLVEPAVAQVLLEQLDRALQRRQRRAQLVRGGRDERAPRRLLAAQLALHAWPARGRGRRPRRGRRRAGSGRRCPPWRRAPRRPAGARGAGRCRVASRMPSSDGDGEADRGGGEEGVAHLVDGGRDVGELLLRDEHEVRVGRTRGRP